MDNEKCNTQSERLKLLTIRLKLTTRELSRLIGMSENSLYKINSGLNDISNRTASKICYFLEQEKGVSVNRQWLLTGEGTMFDEKEVKQYEPKEEPVQSVAEGNAEYDTDYKEKYFALLEEYSRLQAEYSTLLKKMLQQ